LEWNWPFSDKSIIGSSSHQFDAHAYVAILEDSVFQFYRESEKQKKDEN
jgi:hypothetical protein